MKKTTQYIIGFCLAYSLSLQAQLQEKDMQFLKRVSEHYANGYQMEVMVYAFPEASAEGTLIDSCFTAKQQDNMLITTMQYDVLQSDDYLLTANHRNKEIYLTAIQKDSLPLSNNKFEFSAEVLEQSSSIFSTRREDDHLLFEATDLDVYSRIAYHFDATTYALVKVVYDYADNEEYGTPDKVEIHYRNVLINQTLPKQTFDLNQYVSSKDGVFAVNRKYQGYLLNQNL